MAFPSALVFSAALLLWPCVASAQQTTAAPTTRARVTSNQQGNVPPAAQDAAAATESFVDRYGIGVEGGVGLDPELLMFGAHATFGPIFSPRLSFRPGVEFGVGEVTTELGINLDVLYRFPGATSRTAWAPYIGAGPNFALSHQGFSAEDHAEATMTTTTTTGNGATATTTTRNRFDFGDTDFDGGFNFIVGARRPNGVFVEMKATAYGVSNVRLLAGFNF
jgi:hypothetical protein